MSGQTTNSRQRHSMVTTLSGCTKCSLRRYFTVLSAIFTSLSRLNQAKTELLIHNLRKVTQKSLPGIQ